MLIFGHYNIWSQPYYDDSQFEEKEDLGAAATPANHANVPRQPIENVNTINAGQSSTSMDVVNNVQHIQKTPQDPSTSHDFGGMTRIIPSDVDVSQIFLKFILF